MSLNEQAQSVATNSRESFWGRHKTATSLTALAALALISLGSRYDSIKTFAATHIDGSVLEYVPFLDKGLIERQRDIETGYHMDEVPEDQQAFVLAKLNAEYENYITLALIEAIRSTNPDEYQRQRESLGQLTVPVEVINPHIFDGIPTYTGFKDGIRLDLDVTPLQDQLGARFYLEKERGRKLTFGADWENTPTVIQWSSPTVFYSDFFVWIKDFAQTTPEPAGPEPTATPYVQNVHLGESQVDRISDPSMYALARTIRSMLEQGITPKVIYFGLEHYSPFDSTYTFAPTYTDTTMGRDSIVVVGYDKHGKRMFTSSANDAHVDWVWNNLQD